jgi:hypothetical protein
MKVVLNCQSNMAAAPVSPVQSSAAGKRKEPSEVEQDEPAPAQVKAAAKKAKSANEVEQEVRRLLDKKLFGQDDALKVEALGKLTEYFTPEDDNDADQAKEIYRRAVGEWGGCRLVLLALELELDKGDRAKRDLVQGAMRFLLYWNYQSDERRNTMMRFKGVDIVVRAMQACPGDSGIQSDAVTTFLNFTTGNDNTPRILDLVSETCIPLILHVMTTRTNPDTARKHAVVVLGRLCDFAEPYCLEDHFDANTLGVLYDMFRTYENSNDRLAEGVRESCRALSSKMFV